MTALHIACRDGRTDMADVIIQAAEKQAMISHSGKYVKYQAKIQTLLNMAGHEVELVRVHVPPPPFLWKQVSFPLAGISGADLEF